jgi:hypothetical protein
MKTKDGCHLGHVAQTPTNYFFKPILSAPEEEKKKKYTSSTPLAIKK